MKLIEYLPNFMKDIKELQELFDTEDIEVKKLKGEIEKIFSEIIVKTAKSYGLDRYEKIYQINTKSDLLEIRRLKILSKMNDKESFTYKWLDNKLKQLVGENNYKISIEYNNYRIIISIACLFCNIADTLKRELNKSLPVNLIIQVNLFSNCNLYLAGIVHQKQYIRLEVER